MPPPPQYRPAAAATWHSPDPQRIRRNRIAAAFVQLALAGTALVQVLVIPEVLNRRHVLHDFIGGNASLGDVRNADDATARAHGVVLGAVVLTGVLFVVWLWRLRRDAELLNPEIQRFGQGWAIGAWLIPLANLILPYRVVADVAAAGDRTNDRAGRVPAIVKIWWAMWVVAFVGNRVLSSWNPGSVGAFDTYSVFEIAAAAFTILTAVVAIVLVERLTRSFALRWAQPTGAGRPPPSARRW